MFSLFFHRCWWRPGADATVSCSGWWGDWKIVESDGGSAIGKGARSLLGFGGVRVVARPTGDVDSEQI
ncbi:kinesin light chain-like protein [Sesbania bispinosa]|nr:kinesin light chain-like protein [Sesbania bispinosa]